MDKTYEKFLRTGIDLTPLGVERGEGELYFCTPRGASLIGWEGADGIHYCFVRGYGGTVFAVSPMNTAPDYVHAVAQDFADFLRLLLACGHGAAIEQCWRWSRGQFDAYLAENPPTDAALAVMGEIREKLGLAPMEDAWGYIHALQDGFDYGKIKYEDPECIASLSEPEPEPWCVRFHGGRDKPGTELRLDRLFTWAGRECCVPAVYSCAKGLVMDVGMSAPVEEVLAFMARWAPQGKAHYSDFSKADRMRIEYEHPLSLDFSASVTVNGRVLDSEGASGWGWAPIEGWENREAQRAVEHYGLDPGRCWQFSRIRFPWKRRMEIKSLDAVFTPERVDVPGECFTVSRAGEEVQLVSPVDGEQYTLTVCEYSAARTRFRDDSEWEFPEQYVTLEYTLTPELDRDDFQLTDVSEGDRPRLRRSSAGFGPTASASALIAVISGGDGRHAASSSLYFEAPQQIEWLPVFREYPCEALELKLMAPADTN